MPAISRERLSDLLIDPREDLGLEFKGWLDLRCNEDHKATLAKAMLALANHGGGFVVLGLTETPAGAIEAEGRPATFDCYEQDFINGIVQRYCEPSFHCSVHVVANPTGLQFPVVVVPGGHRVPIRAKRSGPNGNIVADNAIYVRKPGPRSEVPNTPQEWDSLLARCLLNRRDELLDQMRDLLLGVVPQSSAPPAPSRLDQWIASCESRWQQLLATLPPDAGPRCVHGYYWFAYEIEGDVRPVELANFLPVLRDSVSRNTGWPPFWVPTRAGIAPYPIDGAVECWIGGDPSADPSERDPAHSDFWRISPDGLAFLLRGFEEDSLGMTQNGRPPPEPGTVFDVTLPVWRIGDAMLHAASLAANMTEGAAVLNVAVRYVGLAGRSLTSVSGRRWVWDGRITRQDSITLKTRVDASSVGPNLAEIIQPLLAPLYGLFDFAELPMELVTEELGRLRSRG